MNVTLCSAFRNSTPTIATCFNQVNALDYALHERGHKLTLVWGEGDSEDGTLSMLQAAKFRFRATVVDCTHGGKAHGSVVNSERFRQLAHVGQQIFAAIPESADAVVWVESDLLWQPETIIGLLDRLADYPCIAPRILLRRAGWGNGVNFYDTLAFVKAGQHFVHRRPYHPANDGHTLLQMDTVGSCVAFRGALARSIEIDERLIMGACEQVRAMGGSVWFDPNLPPVIHL